MLVPRLLLIAVLALTSSHAAATPARFTARTPDEMLALALARARTGGTAGLAGVTLARWLADETRAGSAHGALAAFADAGDDPLAREARWQAHALAPTSARPAGLIDNLAIVGPFRDQGGGLARREGPELAGQRWGDRGAVYDWGAYQARWRPVPARAITARGVPLDLMIHPRAETCSYLATRVRLPAARSFVVSVAASGSVRLWFDGADAGQSDEVHARAVLARLAARIEAAAGDHVLAAKVCTGARPDAGRVLLYAHDDAGRPLALDTTADFALAAPPGKARVTPVPTALGSAIADADPARMLALAMVRGLAGADDLRTPRVPGLLEAVAQRKETSADELAMAALVAPFGAQQSGWLGQAYERAIAAGDHATASFAARRLAPLRARAGFADWAESTARLPPLATEDDAHARLVKALVRAQSRIESVRRSSLAALASLADAQASVALWAEVARLARGLDAAQFRAANQALAALSSFRRGREWVQAQSAVGAAAVARAADEALRGEGLETADALLGVAATLGEADQHMQAAALLEEAARLHPNHGGVFAALARARHRRGDGKGGRAALARARLLAPQEPRHAAEDRLRAGVADPDTGEALPGVPADLLVPPATFLARQRENPARAGEAIYRVLHAARHLALGPDRRVSDLVHTAREVLIEPRGQADLIEPLSVPASEILRARVHRAGGGIEPPVEQRIEGGTPRIRWRELATGDVIEIVTRWWSDGPVGQRGQAPFRFPYSAGSDASRPVLYEELVVESPADAPLAVDLINDPGKITERSDQVVDGRKRVRFTWPNPPRLREEPLRDGEVELAPTVVVGLHASWQEFADWYREAIAGFHQPDAQVEALARELTQGKRSRAEKIAAVFRYVSDRIRYVNYRGAEMWLPNRPQQVLARRQGDCDDKGGLLIALLASLGIDSSLVLVQTRHTGVPALLGAKHAALPIFDHAYVYVPASAQEKTPALWLNATDPHNTVGRLHNGESDVPVLIVGKAGAPVLTRAPAAAPEDHSEHERWKVRLAADGSAVIDAVSLRRGDRAHQARTGLAEADARAPFVESQLFPRSWFPGAEIDPEVSFSDAGEGGVRVGYRARLERFARKEGRELVVPMYEASNITSFLAPLPTRVHPIRLPPQMSPWREVYELAIAAPPGQTMVTLPRAGREVAEFGEAALAVEPRGPREVLIRRTFVLRAWQIPPAKYPAWRAWLQRVDRLLHQSLRLRGAAASPVAVEAP